MRFIGNIPSIGILIKTKNWREWKEEIVEWRRGNIKVKHFTHSSFLSFSLIFSSLSFFLSILQSLTLLSFYFFPVVEPNLMLCLLHPNEGRVVKQMRKKRDPLVERAYLLSGSCTLNPLLSIDDVLEGKRARALSVFPYFLFNFKSIKKNILLQHSFHMKNLNFGK